MGEKSLLGTRENREAPRRIRCVVYGTVQGVGFRWTIHERAARLGCTGYVRNLPDGCVELVAEGSASALEGLASFCRSGPPGAHVTEFNIEAGAATGEFSGFEIR